MSFVSQNSPSNGLYRPLADINVTPLVDVMLVLLIIFMVTAPLLTNGLKVDLPQAKQAQPLNPKDPVIVTVTKDGKLSLGADEVEKATLIEALHAKLDGDQTRIIHLRGDKEVAYGDVVAIMDLLATNGWTRIAIVTDARAKADADKIEAKRVEPRAAVPDNAIKAGADPAAPTEARSEAK